MRYGSVCSGIEAASVAWHPMGWEPSFFAEIDKFPSSVLAHHYPTVPNMGDFTTIKEGDAEPIELLVGGTPCQSFSVAGKRLGLDDPRGNLALEFLALARRLRPRWLVFENVPGLLSSDEGRDFGAFLGLLVECGYGWAYRVLDAQYVRVDGHARAVPQRRRRVFVVGYLGDWRPSAAVLLEPEGLRGDFAPRRKPGKGVAPTIASRPTGGGGLGTDFDCDGGLVSHSLNAHAGRIDGESETFVAHALDSFSAGRATEDGTGRGCPIIGVVTNDSAPVTTDGGHCPTLRVGTGLEINSAPAIAFDTTQVTSKANRSVPKAGDPCHPLAAEGHAPAIAFNSNARASVRRLTPKECERLQGFPDNYTLVPYRGKPAADGPRYKALGNSMAVNCMRFIGARISMFERTVLRRNAA